MIDPLQPAPSRGDILPVEQLAGEAVRAGVAAWRILKRRRRYPARADLTPFHLAPILRDIMIVEVLEGGGDYEYRFVGENLIRGHEADFTGKRLSALVESWPRFGLGQRMLYEMVRAGGEPLGYRGWIGEDMPGAAFVYHENAVLPLGPDDARVDHLLIVSLLVPRRAAGG